VRQQPYGRAEEPDAGHDARAHAVWDRNTRNRPVPAAVSSLPSCSAEMQGCQHGLGREAHEDVGAQPRRSAVPFRVPDHIGPAQDSGAEQERQCNRGQESSEHGVPFSATALSGDTRGARRAPARERSHVDACGAHGGRWRLVCPMLPARGTPPPGRRPADAGRQPRSFDFQCGSNDMTDPALLEPHSSPARSPHAPLTSRRPSTLVARRRRAFARPRGRRYTRSTSAWCEPGGRRLVREACPLAVDRTSRVRDPGHDDPRPLRPLHPGRAAGPPRSRPELLGSWAIPSASSTGHAPTGCARRPAGALLHLGLIARGRSLETGRRTGARLRRRSLIPPHSMRGKRVSASTTARRCGSPREGSPRIS
jgi:hypothetical protein